jgi:hypothetical protein
VWIGKSCGGTSLTPSIRLMPQNLVYINGFDHPNIIAGAGTMAIEMLNQVRACCLWAVPCYSRASLTFSNALGA